MNDLPQLTRLPRAEAKVRTRQALLAAAESLLSKLGYQGATLDRIAAEAGYTKGAVYWHFANKEALFLELLEQALEKNVARLDAMIAEAGGDSGQLEQNTARYVEHLDRTIPLLALELDIEARRNPSLAATHERVVRAHQEALSRVIERYFLAVGREPPMAPRDFANLILALSEGTVLSAQARPDHRIPFATAMKNLLGLPIER